MRAHAREPHPHLQPHPRARVVPRLLAQDGQRVHDVVLPSWARGSPHEFVRVMRAALESEHVSAHLHQWIDLIFGASQQGAAAAEARNLFFHTTYDTFVDTFTALQGHDREVAIAQVREFGQTPSRLFLAAHPPRGVGPSPLPSLALPPPPAGVSAIAASAPPGVPIIGLWVASRGERLLVLDASLTLRWLQLKRTERATSAAASGAALAPTNAAVCASTPPRPTEGSASRLTRLSIVAAPLAPLRLRWRAAQLPTLAGWVVAAADGDLLYACGSWVNGVHHVSGLQAAAKGGGLGGGLSGGFGGGAKATLPAPAAQRLSPPLARHATCVAASPNGCTVLVGCADGTCLLWRPLSASTVSGMGIGAASGGSAKAAMPSLSMGLAGRLSSPSIGGSSAAVGSGEPPSRSKRAEAPADATRLCGHVAPVTCVALQVELALAISGSEDGTCLVHDTLSGRQIRSLRHPSGCIVHALCVSGEGELVMYSAADSVVHLYSLHGELLGSIGMRRGPLRAIHATQEGAPGFFVFAEERAVSVRRSHDLSLVAQLLELGSVVCSAAIHEGQHGQLIVMLGLVSGQVATWTLELRGAVIRRPEE